MATTTTCHTDSYLTFPVECVRCGQAPRTILTVNASRRIDLLFVEFDQTVELTIPVCRRCGAVRRIGGFCLGFVIVVGGIGAGIYVLANAPDQTRVWYVAGFLIWFAAVLLFIRNWHSRWMDRLLAGVSAGPLRKNGTFSLWVRRDELITQVSYQQQPRKYVETAPYATHEERTDQQLAAWRGKCLIGFMMLLAAWWIWYDLTQLEAGLRQQASLPIGLILLYDLFGKWPASLVLGLPGLLIGGWGVRQFIKDQNRTG